MTFSHSRRSVLVDSSAYFAFTDGTDTYHRDAQVIQRRIVSERWQVFTTNFVIAETHALILNRLNRRAAVDVLSRIDASRAAGRLNVIRVEPEDELRAREIIWQYDDKDFTLTDATSFAVMDRIGIAYAFTFDRDFTQYGLAVLTP